MRYIFQYEAKNPPRGRGFININENIKGQIVKLLDDTKNQLTASVISATHNTSSNVRGTQLRLDINDTNDGKKKLQLQSGSNTYSSVYISAEFSSLFNELFNNKGELLQLKNKPTEIPAIDKINEAYSKICGWYISESVQVEKFIKQTIPQLNMLRQKFLQLYNYLKNTCELIVDFDKLDINISANTSVPENPTVSVMDVVGSIYRLSEHSGLNLFFTNVIPALISHIDDPPQIQMVDNENLNGDTLNDVLYNCLLYSLNNAKVIVLTRFSS